MLGIQREKATMKTTTILLLVFTIALGLRLPGCPPNLVLKLCSRDPEPSNLVLQGRTL